MIQTTREATIRRGTANSLGWTALEPAAGEGTSASAPMGRVLGALWHLSDMHVCDVESPARLVHLDRFGDADSPVAEDLGHIGTYRPQEILAVHVAIAMVRTVNRRTIGPVTGHPIDAVLVTGDLVDNAQMNELSWLAGILFGGPVVAKSGSPEHSTWVGSRQGHPWDVRYWHPDGAPRGEPIDLPTRSFGYPVIPGLVTAAHAPVHSPGLDLPVLAVHGNHDGLLQGTVPASDELRALATGDRLAIGLAPEQDPLEIADALREVGPARYIHSDTTPWHAVPADPARALLAVTEFAEQLTHRGGMSAPSGAPRGVDRTNTWVADCGELRVIGLDTVNPHGGWQGSIDVDQLTWLVAELDRSRDRPVVIATHHPSPTLTNDYAPANSPRRVLGPELCEVLLDAHNVIAWMAGHIHAHAALWHGRALPDGEDPDHGFWEFTTGSLIDWPQQGRIVEFIREDGRIWIVSTVVDHDAPIEPPGSLTRADPPPEELAAWSRLLAANDYRIRGESFRRYLLDSHASLRNVVWSLADPFAS